MVLSSHSGPGDPRAHVIVARRCGGSCDPIICHASTDHFRAADWQRQFLRWQPRGASADTSGAGAIIFICCQIIQGGGAPRLASHLHISLSGSLRSCSLPRPAPISVRLLRGALNHKCTVLFFNILNTWCPPAPIDSSSCFQFVAEDQIPASLSAYPHRAKQDRLDL